MNLETTAPSSVGARFIAPPMAPSPASPPLVTAPPVTTPPGIVPGAPTAWSPLP
jgi:hypothetical protein